MPARRTRASLNAACVQYGVCSHHSKRVASAFGRPLVVPSRRCIPRDRSETSFVSLSRLSIEQVHGALGYIYMQVRTLFQGVPFFKAPWYSVQVYTLAAMLASGPLRPYPPRLIYRLLHGHVVRF